MKFLQYDIFWRFGMDELRFGAFVLDLEGEELRASGRAVTIPRKNLEVLRVLVLAKGQLVPREALVAEVWPDTVVEEATIRQNIYTLRMILREIDGGREYIETVPKAGYRLGVPVEAANLKVEEQPRRPPAERHAVVRKLALLLAVPALVLPTGWIAWSRYESSAKIPFSADELARQGWLLLDSRNSMVFGATETTFDEALRLNPKLTAAREGKAVLYALMQKEREAESEAGRAGELNPLTALPSAVRGFLRMMYHWDWKEGSRLLRVVETRGCAQPVCRQWNSLSLALGGDLSKAIREATGAVEIDPGSLAPRAQRAQIYYWAGEIDAAIADARIVLDSGGVWTHARYHLWKALLAKGDRHGAAVNALLAFEPDWYRLGPGDEFHRLMADEAGYDRPVFWRRLFQVESDLKAGPCFLAEIAMAAGDSDSALQQLETGLKTRNFFLPFARREPLFAPLHGNPRYEAVMRAIGL